MTVPARIPFEPPAWLALRRSALVGVGLAAMAVAPGVINALADDFSPLGPRFGVWGDTPLGVVASLAGVLGAAALAVAVAAPSAGAAAVRCITGCALAGGLHALGLALYLDATADRFLPSWGGSLFLGMTVGSLFGALLAVPVACAVAAELAVSHERSDVAIAVMAAWLTAVSALACRMFVSESSGLDLARLATLAGVVALATTTKRIVRRRRWLHAVRAGNAPGWRIEPAEHGGMASLPRLVAPHWRHTPGILVRVGGETDASYRAGANAAIAVAPL